MAARPDHPTSEIDRLSRIIQDRPLIGETKLVAIDGRGGAGKSSLAKLLKARMQNSKVVSVDDFPCSPEEHPFHPSGTQTEISVSRIINEVLIPLKEGREARFRKRSWWSADLDKLHEEQRIVPGGLVFIEGCYSLRYELRDYYDLRIWIECNLKEALQRSISRDGEEIRYHWEEVYAPNETRYIKEHCPMECADVVLECSAYNLYKILSIRDPSSGINRPSKLLK